MMLPVVPVIDVSVRGLCVRPYAGHTKGCPNFGKCERCPPKIGLFPDLYDMTQPMFAVINEFDLASHVERMQANNPSWSYRQLSCVLYWQPKARKQLKEKIDSLLPLFEGYTATWCPEAMGVNVTQTLANVGIILEWPAVNVARQVALLAVPKEGTCNEQQTGGGFSAPQAGGR